MEAHHEMHRALDVLREARSFAIENFKRNFPDLYALSARAFEVMPAGSFSHHDRLGEYLTEWSNSLGKSPLAALVFGSQSEVHDDLVGRIGKAHESTEKGEIAEHAQSQPIAVKGHRAYMAFCNYDATGEGVTIFIAAASSAEGAKHTFLQEAPEYFHRGMQIEAIYDDGSPDARRMRPWIPQPALDLIVANPPATTTAYYATIHFNLA